MTDAEVIGLVESSHAYTLALVEVLARKLTRAGAFLSKNDVKQISKRQEKIVKVMNEKRRRSATSLILPPGVMG